MVPFERCACGKISYPSRREAREKLLQRWAHGGTERSSYWCDQGQCYHLSKRKRKNP